MTVHYKSASYRKQIMRLLRVQSILGSNGGKKSLEVMTVSNDYAIISDKKKHPFTFFYILWNYSQICTKIAANISEIR